MRKEIDDLKHQLSHSVTCQEKPDVIVPFSSEQGPFLWQRLMKEARQIEPDKLIANQHLYYSGQTQNYLPHGFGTWHYANIGAYYEGE